MNPDKDIKANGQFTTYSLDQSTYALYRPDGTFAAQNNSPRAEMLMMLYADPREIECSGEVSALQLLQKGTPKKQGKEAWHTLYTKVIPP